jgi:hypothetical protein
MAIPATTEMTLPSVVKKEIDDRVDQAWEAAGFVTEDGLRDTKAMQEAAYEEVIHHVANTKEEVAKKAITRGELYAKVFPDGPGTDGSDEPLDEFEEAVRQQLERDVWSLTQSKSEGALQKRLGEENSSLVLVRENIRRGLDPAAAVFLTDNPTLIMEGVVDKEVKAYERKAANLRKQLEMVTKRHDELSAQVNSRVRLAQSKTKAELNFAKSGVGELTESVTE